MGISLGKKLTKQRDRTTRVTVMQLLERPLQCIARPGKTKKKTNDEKPQLSQNSLLAQLSQVTLEIHATGEYCNLGAWRT